MVLFSNQRWLWFNFSLYSIHPISLSIKQETLVITLTTEKKMAKMKVWYISTVVILIANQENTISTNLLRLTYSHVQRYSWDFQSHIKAQALSLPQEEKHCWNCQHLHYAYPLPSLWWHQQDQNGFSSQKGVLWLSHRSLGQRKIVGRNSLPSGYEVRSPTSS